MGMKVSYHKDLQAQLKFLDLQHTKVVLEKVLFLDYFKIFENTF